jgi:hypothetical protein
MDRRHAISSVWRVGLRTGLDRARSRVANESPPDIMGQLKTGEHQIVLLENESLTTLSFTDPDISRLVAEAEMRDLRISQLLSEAVSGLSRRK